MTDLVEVFNMRISRLRIKISDAKERNDPREIERLREELDEAIAERDKLIGDNE